MRAMRWRRLAIMVAFVVARQLFGADVKELKERREVWNIFVAAYQSVAHELKEGLTEAEAFEIWKNELLRHHESAKSLLAQRAIETWSERKNIP